MSKQEARIFLQVLKRKRGKAILIRGRALSKM